MSVEKKYLHNIDLVNNKLINPLLNPLTTAQRTAVGTLLTTLDQGYVCFDTTQNIQYFWNGSAWVTVTAVTSWGSITGAITNQLDLTAYLSANYYPLSSNPAGYLTAALASTTYVPLTRNLTINGTTYNLSADRSWTIDTLPSQAGQSGKYLTTNGAVASWASISLPTGAALTRVNDTNVTLTLGGTPSTALLQGVSLTLGWNGTLADSRITSASTWNSKEPGITAGTTSQYWRGDKTWQTFPTIPTVGTWGTLNYPTWTSGTPFVKMTAAGIFALDTNTYLTSITSSDVTTALGYTPVTNARTLTINGTTYDLTANRTWSVGTVTSVSATAPITSSGGTTPTISTSMATNKLIGRSSAGTGVMEEITVGTGLSLSAGTLSSTAEGILHGTASGTNTYTVTIAGATAYADGDAYLIRFPNGNTGTATLNISGLGAVTLYRNNDGPIIGGDIWNGSEMLCIYNSTTGGFQLIGTSPNAMYAYVTNDDSVAITKGQVVYAFGGQGDRMTVKLANNVGDATSAQTVGVVLSTSIAANQKGVIITQGLLDGLNILPTATYNDGDPLYLGATPGSITNIKPYAPNHLVYLGNVTTASNGAAGRWYVRIQNGYELDELHNVQAQTPSLKDTLWYDNTVSPAQWKTASISTILGYTPLQRSVNVVSTNTAAGSVISTDYVYLVSGTTTITLPTPVGNTNQYTIKRVGTSTVSIATTSGTIDGSASPITINVQYVSLTLVSDGTNWFII